MTFQTQPNLNMRHSIFLTVNSSNAPTSQASFAYISGLMYPLQISRIYRSISSTGRLLPIDGFSEPWSKCQILLAFQSSLQMNVLLANIVGVPGSRLPKSNASKSSARAAEITYPMHVSHTESYARRCRNFLSPRRCTSLRSAGTVFPCMIHAHVSILQAFTRFYLRVL